MSWHVFTRHAGSLYFVAQLRGNWNFDKQKPESWSGGTQPLVHGGMEAIDRDNFELTWKREAEEEVGNAFLDRLHKAGVELHRIGEHRTDDKLVIHFGSIVPIEDLSLIRWHAGTGGLDLILEEDILAAAELGKLPKDQMVIGVAMHADDKEMALKGYKMFAEAI